LRAQGMGSGREKLLEMEKRVLEGKGQATTAQPPR
jgi:hypothetical protein